MAQHVSAAPTHDQTFATCGASQGAAFKEYKEYNEVNQRKDQDNPFIEERRFVQKQATRTRPAGAKPFARRVQALSHTANIDAKAKAHAGKTQLKVWRPGGVVAPAQGVFYLFDAFAHVV